MSKHTPGPWTSYTGTNSIWAEGKRAVCIVTGARKHEDEERDANANLIAAAPDLLEALEHIMRCIPMGGFAQIHHGSSTWEQIDAAVSKARGELFNA